jgi:hypothetical protein
VYVCEAAKGRNGAPERGRERQRDIYIERDAERKVESMRLRRKAG